MKDEEFKRKLESILENLYSIDREAKEYFRRKHLDAKQEHYLRKSYSENYSTRSLEESKDK